MAAAAAAEHVNQWVQVTFVLNNGTGYLYVNGNSEGTGSLTTVNTPSGNQDVKIGERVLGGSIPFHGSLDEIRIWDVAKTITEIQASMNSELCGQHPNLQLYLQFNEGNAGGTNTGVTSAADASGNGYTGILNDFNLTGTTSNWVDGSGIGDGTSVVSIQESACDTFTWTANATLYTTSGVYTEILTNAQGCDSTVTLDLTINTVNSSVTQDELVLTADEIGATYQWVDCPGMIPINGATSQSYTATTSGDYAVIVTANGCSDTSACYTVTLVGTIENEFGQELLLFPNPTNGEFSINLGEKYNSTTITITDLSGKLILSNIYNNSQLLNLKLKEPPGVYLLIIESENKKAVIRLVKNE